MKSGKKKIVDYYGYECLGERVWPNAEMFSAMAAKHS